MWKKSDDRRNYRQRWRIHGTHCLFPSRFFPSQNLEQWNNSVIYIGGYEVCFIFSSFRKTYLKPLSGYLIFIDKLAILRSIYSINTAIFNCFCIRLRNKAYTNHVLYLYCRLQTIKYSQTLLFVCENLAWVLNFYLMVVREMVMNTYSPIHKYTIIHSFVIDTNQ